METFTRRKITSDENLVELDNYSDEKICPNQNLNIQQILFSLYVLQLADYCFLTGTKSFEKSSNKVVKIFMKSVCLSLERVRKMVKI